jgi:hypothetical protein
MEAIEILRNGENRAVRLLKPIRASNGQEFLSGWIAGFSPASAAYLVRAGFAAWLDGDSHPKEEPTKDLVMAPPSGPMVAPVTRAPISIGGRQDDMPSDAPTNTSQPSRRRRG